MKSSGNIKAESKMKQTLVENRGVTNNICIHEMIPKNIDFGVVSRLRVGSLLRTWADVSRINYMSLEPLDIITSGQSIRRRSIGLSGKKYSIHCFVPSELRNKSEEDLFAEQFPVNVTSLMNEDQLWGFFYIFPELYADIYSPIICVRNIEDVPELVGGILTRAMVTACLSYLSRTPILQDFVYIKLDLSTKHLTNIDVLQHYKYLVYLDISSNLLTEISVLSYLPYLQFLSVAFNRLNTVLEYDTPQWFLTEVHYNFNSVKRIRDLSGFWSITILDLSHNNIKYISGLENLRYLRRLDLSFNHIQRLENLNNLRLLWLDVSYNNISSCEIGPQRGLWSLLHLEYLNLNENNLTSLKIFSGCNRLRELHARNNRLSILLELAVYLRQMRRLIVIDLRANPMCSTPGYKEVVINTFPLLLSLDAEEVDPITQRTYKMDMTPNVNTFATRRLLRLLYVEQLSRALVSPYTPPADTTEVPIVVLVGYEAVGKGKLARRLVNKCSKNVEMSYQHTTAPFHFPGHYKEVSRSKFDDMLLHGDLLTYAEMAGESYGLSRQESFTKNSKVKIATMDLLGALMLKLRGRRPFLILATCRDKIDLQRRQHERKILRDLANEQRMSVETPLERSTLQVLLSGRIIITGILNEIFMSLPEQKEQSEFVIESECSLMMNSEVRQAVREYIREVNLLTLLASSTTSLEEGCNREHDKNSQLDPSLYSLYKESQGTDEYYYSYVNGQNSHQERNQQKKANEIRQSRTKQEKQSNISRPKSVDFSRYASSTWKGLSAVPDSAKSSKSVTFTSQDNNETQNQEQVGPLGMLIEPKKSEKEVDKSKVPRSISTKIPWPTRGQSKIGSGGSLDDLDLWLAFLAETGLMQASSSNYNTWDTTAPIHQDTRIDDPKILKEFDFYNKVLMDDPDEAFHKVKKIIHDIVDSQPQFKPMFDIDFANLNCYNSVKKKLANIINQIAPQSK
ncbi:uncharacterized protein LOC131847195 isoform X2 [Achroia grisella]|uniref:uncharacterized protein LOC131847195 isoform X2 n=1 Tax=Achroia grisella TaxID=688607 RepID=UPI0027D2284B|nr:uncharacterized protein LOC131847195 isoform X2 [Achroia grisella]